MAQPEKKKWVNLLEEAKTEIFTDKSTQEIKDLLNTTSGISFVDSKLFHELKVIIVALHTIFLKEETEVKFYLNIAKELDNDDTTTTTTNYNLLVSTYKNIYHEQQPNVIFFLVTSLRFLIDLDNDKNLAENLKNMYKTSGIVAAFYNVFIKPELSVIGGRKRISKSFQNSRIKRKSYFKRRTVKSRRLRRRRSVKRRRL